jgi:hypothetical protein
LMVLTEMSTRSNGIALPLPFVDDLTSIFPICDTYVSTSQNAGSTKFFE